MTHPLVAHQLSLTRALDRGDGRVVARIVPCAWSSEQPLAITAGATTAFPSFAGAVVRAAAIATVSPSTDPTGSTGTARWRRTLTLNFGGSPGVAADLRHVRVVFGDELNGPRLVALSKVKRNGYPLGRQLARYQRAGVASVTEPVLVVVVVVALVAPLVVVSLGGAPGVAVKWLSGWSGGVGAWWSDGVEEWSGASKS